MLEGLTTAISVDQERMGGNPRSTVGTATDPNVMLRVLWSRLGNPQGFSLHADVAVPRAGGTSWRSSVGTSCAHRWCLSG